MVPFTATPEDAVSGQLSGKWVVSVDGNPFCYAYLFTSPNGDDLERWWITPLEGGLKDNPKFLNNGRRVSNVTLRKGTRLSEANSYSGRNRCVEQTATMLLPRILAKSSMRRRWR